MDIDYVARDGKREPAWSALDVLGALALMPLALVMVPVSLVSLIATKTVHPAPETSYAPVTVPKNLPAFANREFDIIVYGATGFVGRLECEYILKTYGTDKIKWAVAGRRKDALEQVLSSLGHAGKVHVIAADSSNYESLKAMAVRTRVVLTSVGPFELYGTEVVRACIESGTSYRRSQLGGRIGGPLRPGGARSGRAHCQFCRPRLHSLGPRHAAMRRCFEEEGRNHDQD